MSTIIDKDLNQKYTKRFNLLFGAVIASFLLGLIVLAFSPGKSVKSGTKNAFSSFFSGSYINPSSDCIAVVNINGVIQFGGDSGFLGQAQKGAEYWVSLINEYTRNSKVKGLILRINSPGGTIGASQEVYNAVKRFREAGKPVVASMADIAASGGYYIASACDTIIANPGTITGSIGVIVQTPSLKGLFEKIGVKQNVFKSGKHKDILASHRDVTPEEKIIIQTVVDDAFKEFFRIVKESRDIKESLLRKYADGRIYTGTRAKKLGLIDEIGDFAFAIKMIGKETGLGDEPELYNNKGNAIERLMMGFKKNDLSSKLLNLNPDNGINVYYLYMP